MINPVSAISYIGVDLEYGTYKGDLPGASDQTSETYLFRPSVGIPLANGRNILMRATVPMMANEPKYVADREYYDFLVRQKADTLSTDGAFETGHPFMGDLSYDFAFGGVSDHGWISMYGVAGVQATAKDTSAARGQYLLGPEIAFGKVTEWGVIGTWLTHMVDVAGKNPAGIDTQLTSAKIFFTYSLGNGWQVFSNPTITYDWEAAGGNKLLLPIGGGVSKVTRIGNMPLSLALEIQNYIVSPDAFGPEWRLRFNVTPVFPNLFRK
ncbi:MAG: hypothetical protein OQJ84_07185 [Xanthomonadales bacterium]|nr:hypothetical protein [Xanthomonadales bacterium]